MTESIPETGTIETESESDAAAARRLPRHRHPERDVVLISFVLAVLSVGLFLTLPDLETATRPTSWALFAAIMVGYAFTEYSVFRFHFRREAIAFSLSEIP